MQWFLKVKDSSSVVMFLGSLKPTEDFQEKGCAVLVQPLACSILLESRDIWRAAFLGVLMHHQRRYYSFCGNVLQFFHLYDCSLQQQGEKCPSLFSVTVANTLPAISFIVFLRRTLPGGKTPSWKCDIGEKKQEHFSFFCNMYLIHYGMKAKMKMCGTC